MGFWGITIAIFLFVLAVYIFLFSVSKTFDGYMREKWPDVVNLYLSVFLGAGLAFAGIVWAFHQETQRAIDFEVQTFKRSFAAVIVETAENQAKINKLKKEITSTHFNLASLDTNITNAMVSNPLFYRYTGQEYWYTIKTYIESIALANRMLDFVFEQFKINGQISQKNLEDLTARLNQALFYLYILQMQTQLYVYGYDVHAGHMDNYDELLSWLKGQKKISIEEIQARTREIENMDERQKKDLQQAFKKALEK